MAYNGKQLRTMSIAIAAVMVVTALVVITPGARATAPTATITLPTGTAAGAVVYDSGNHDLYVADPSGNCVVLAISTATNAVVSTISTGCLGSSEQVLAYDPYHGDIMVAGYGSASLYVISDSTNTIVTTETSSGPGHLLPTGTVPYAVVYDPANHDSYFSDFCGGTCTSSITVMSGGTFVKNYGLSYGAANAIGYDPASSTIYVSTTGGTTPYVNIFSTSSNSVVATDAVTWTSPNCFGYSLANGDMYVTEGTSGNNLYVIASSGTSKNTIIATLTVGTSPYAVAYDPANSDIVVTNQGAATVSLISSTNAVALTVTVGSTPTIPMYDPASGNVYVTNEGGSSVSVISPTGSVVDTDALSANPDATAFDSNLQNVDVAAFVGASAWILPSTRAIAAGTAPGNPAVSLTNGDLYYANAGSGTVTAISSVNAVAATITVGSGPTGMAYNPVSGDIIVANTVGGSISAITSTNTVTTVTTGVGTAPTGVASATSAPGYSYVTDNVSSGLVYVVNPVGPVVVTTISVGAFPSAIAYDPISNLLYVTNYGGSSVSIISPTSNTVVSTPVVGPGPNAVAYDTLTGHAIVADWGTPTVTIFSGTGVVGSVTVSTPAAAVADDPGTGGFVLALRQAGVVEWMSPVGGIQGTQASTGLFPNSVAWDSFTNNVYVTNWGTGTVTVYEAGYSVAGVSLPVSVNSEGAVADPSNGDTYCGTAGGPVYEL